MISKKQHLLHAAIFWTGVGGVLGFVGIGWVWHGFDNPWIWLGLVITLGVVKGKFALGRAAGKTLARIEALPEHSPFHQVFSRGQWMLVFGMMLLGFLIRHSGLDKSIRGLVLSVVGIALLYGSLILWKAMCKLSQQKQRRYP